MVCGLLRQWDTIRRYSSRSEEIALLFMKLRGTLRRATVMLISFAFTKTKMRHTDPGVLRCADSCLYTRHAVEAYDTQFVDHQSASLHGKRAIYLATDHSGLNKFRGPEDENFLLVRPEIQRIVQTAPQRVEEQYRCTVFSIPLTL